MLAVIRKRNPYFRPGTWVECYDDGCRAVDVEQVDNRLQVIREKGIIIPQKDLAPFMSRVQKRGLDK